MQLRAHRALVLLGAVAVFVYPLAFYSAMHLAGVAIGTVISLASAPLASGMLERVLDKHRLDGWWFTAAVLGIVGSILLITASTSNATGTETRIVFGIVLGLLAGIAYAT